jgi:hypothetical protein
MTSTWLDLANSSRWRGVVSFIRNWIAPFDSAQGMPVDKLDEVLREKGLTLPAAVREWYLLAAHWDQGGLNVWNRPAELAISEGVVWILTDREGINHWGVRITDIDIEDPPVVSYEADPPGGIDFPDFRRFVAAMIANDFIFDYETEEPVDLNRDAAIEGMTCFVSTRCGSEFLIDAPLESATIVMFAYPKGGPVSGKSRTAEGRARLEELRIHKA